MLLKTGLLGLGFHWDFASSCLDSKALTKALLFMDGCQVIVAVGDTSWGPPILPSDSLIFNLIIYRRTFNISTESMFVSFLSRCTVFHVWIYHNLLNQFPIDGHVGLFLVFCHY